MKRLLLALSLGSIPLIPFAQNLDSLCGSSELHQHLLNSNPEYAKHFLNLESQVQYIIENGYNGFLPDVFTIPVVVHVIHLGESVGSGTNISDAQILDAIDGLNDRYSNTIGSGLDIEINFCLATRDPNGDSTSGIVRVDGSGLTDYAGDGIEFPGCGTGVLQDSVKDLSKWPVSDYYNIWVVNKICGGIYAGYAYFPWGAPYDGTVIISTSMTYGSTTLTHEVGHGYYLYHTFEGYSGSTCPEDSSCIDNGDRICDTQPHKQTDCGSSNPCSGSGTWDNSRFNYLSYCGTRNRFSAGQKERMRAAAVVFPRLSLISSLGCVPVMPDDAGITDILHPVASTYSSICSSDSLSPKVTLKNFGSDTLTSANIKYQLDGGSVNSYSWTGSLAYNSSENVTLPAIAITTGALSLRVFATDPNGNTDGYAGNDTLDLDFSYTSISPLVLSMSGTDLVCNGDSSGTASVTVGSKVVITEDFEGTSDWTIVNGWYVNGWHIDSATSNGGSESIYISDDADSNKYTINSSAIVHFYKDFRFPSDATDIQLTFDWKGYGESGFDYMRVYLVPTSVVPSPGYSITSGQIGSTYNQQSSFTTTTINISVVNAGQARRLVFSWRNDNNTGTQPPAAVDNIQISYNIPANTPYDYEWSTSPSQTTSTAVDLPAGTYTVTVTDAGGCSDTASVTITEPDPVPAPTITPDGPTTFCQGESVMLTSSSATTYEWSTGATTQSITVTTSGSYNVTITDSVGCPASGSAASVTVNANPTPSITPDGPTTFCEGGSVTLTSSAASSYSWSTGATTQAIVVSTSGNYNVTVTDANGCEGSASAVAVTVNSNPTPTITPNGPTTFCEDESVMLSSSSASSYLWSTSATTQSISVTTSGTYNVTVTDANGCTGGASSVTITVNTNPTPSITPDGPTTFCEGDSVMLTSSSAVSYLWSNSATTQSISTPTSGTYNVTVTDANGCEGSASAVNVTVNDNPEPTITPDGPTTFCEGGSVMLTSSSAGSYEWSTGATTQAITVSTSGNYNVTVTDSNGCEGSASAIAVTVNTNPTPTITPDGPTTFCDGDSVTLMSSSASAYEWSTGATTQSITVTASGTFNVTVTDANGCEGSASDVTVTVNDNPIPTITPDGPTTFCDGDSVVLESSSAASYLWSNSAITQTIVVTTSGAYTVTVTDANGCQGSATPVDVIVHDNPTPAITPDGPTTFCDGGSVMLTSSSASSYLWSTSATTQAITATTSGTFNVTVTDVNGCEGSASDLVVTVNDNPTPVITPDGPTTFCDGGSVMLESSPAVNYLWSNGATTQSISVSASGIYTVAVTDVNGCAGVSAPLTVTVNANPTPTITPGGPVTFCEGDSVMLMSSPAAAYAWSTSDTSQSVTVTTSGTYNVTVTDGNGCEGSAADVIVTVNPNPTPSITPDGPTTFCDGGSVGLMSSAGSAYLWSTGATVQTIAVGVSGTYDVTVTDVNGCIGASSPVIVTVHSNPTPIISANGPGFICAGDSVTLTSTPASSYLWSNGATTQAITIMSTGSYNVTVTDANGCQGSASPQPVFSDTLVVTISASGPLTFCDGDSVMLSVVVTGGSSPYAYTWSTGQFLQTITVKTSGNYSITAMDASGCEVTAGPVTVTVHPNPTPVITPGGPTNFCDGGSVMLTSSSANAYLWNTSATTQSIVATSSGSYNVTVTDANGCIGDATPVEVTAHPNPTPTITPDGPTALCDSGSVTLTASPAISYLWSNGDTTQFITVSAAGSYGLTVTDTNGCVGSATPMTVTVNPTPTPVITPGGPTTFCDGESVMLSASVATTYLWSNGATTQSITVTASGAYDVTVTDTNGCEGSAAPVTVTVHPNPPVPVISQQGTLLICSATGMSQYEWFLNNNPLPACNSDTCMCEQDGAYKVTITDANGCSSSSVDFNANDCAVGTAAHSSNRVLRVYPNPSKGLFMIEVLHDAGGVAHVSVFNAIGQAIHSERVGTGSVVTIELSDVSRGIYTLRVESEGGIYIQKLVIE